MTYNSNICQSVQIMLNIFQMDRTLVTEETDSGSIPDQVKSKTKRLALTAFRHVVQH